MKSRWYVEVRDSSYGYDGYFRVYLPVGVSEVADPIKCLKKVYKRFCKMYQNMNDFDVQAYVESEDGDIQNISIWWFYQSLEYVDEEV